MRPSLRDQGEDFRYARYVDYTLWREKGFVAEVYDEWERVLLGLMTMYVHFSNRVLLEIMYIRIDYRPLTYSPFLLLTNDPWYIVEYHPSPPPSFLSLLRKPSIILQEIRTNKPSH